MRTISDILIRIAVLVRIIGTAIYDAAAFPLLFLRIFCIGFCNAFDNNPVIIGVMLFWFAVAIAIIFISF